MPTHYEVLGVSPGADAEAIHSAYRTLAKRAHPDAGGDGDRFRRIAQAYETLRDGQKRRVYNLLIEAKHREAEGRALATPLGLWANVFVSLCTAIVSAVCFVRGDLPGHYNGWLEAAGWALGLTAWRMFADRRYEFRNPLLSLRDGVAIAACTALLFVWQMVSLFVLLMLILGGLAAVEWAMKHF